MYAQFVRQPQCHSQRHWCIDLVLAVMALAGLVLPSRAADFLPAELPASTTRSLIDPEFNRAKGQFAWVDLAGSIWVGGIDRATGEFVPPSGKLALIDKAAAPIGYDKAVFCHCPGFRRR